MSTPQMKQRKHPQLWQSYLWWYELMEMRKRHLLRISAAERGVSQYDADFERDMLSKLAIDISVEPKNAAERDLSVKTVMINYGSAVGPIWDWCISHKGVGEHLAAQLLAHIDDIDNFPTVSKLWRFAGFAVFEGQAEKGAKGDIRHFNSRLKGVCYNIADQFIRHQSQPYIYIYYEEKARQRELHPVPYCLDCQAPAEKYQKKVNGELVDAHRCPAHKKDHTIKWSDAHVHNMAWRKMVKEFLKDLWVKWNDMPDIV